MKIKMITASIVFILLVPFIFGGCSRAANDEGFAIYLTKNNVPVQEMQALSHVDIANKPLISGDDIIAYYWDTHDIQLTAEAFKRVDALQIPTTGVAFVVCVDKQPVYWGAFWAGYSSQSFDGITIMMKPSLAGDNRIAITPGYPSSSFYQGNDPRSYQVIKDSLKAAGKLN